MATQTLTLVVLPNGMSSKGALRLSVFLTPRLHGATELHSFPDILNWTAQVKTHGLKFKIGDGTRSTVAGVSTQALRPDIWSAIFTPKTLVEPYVIPDFEKRLFVSYPARDALAYAKYAYQILSANVLGNTSDQEPILNTLLRDLAFRNGRDARDPGGSNLDAALAQLRVSLWRQQNDGGSGILAVRSESAGVAAIAPDGIATTGVQPANTRDMIQRFALFHAMPPAPNRADLPRSPADFAKLLDFHKAMTALSSYPLLLRALGLVFDLEIPANSFGDSPATAGGAYATLAVEEVSAEFPWKIKPTFFLPQTAYFRSGKHFEAAPITTSGNVAVGKYNSGDVIDGYLVLSPDSFNLAQLDLDGALLQALSLADALAFADFRNSTRTNGTSIAVEQVLAALRSGGVSLMASGRAAQVLQAVHDNRSFNDALTSGKDGTPRPFHVLDLVRGYRIDIFSSQTNRWYSLHRRNETFKFGPSADPVLHRDDQEGFTQLATAQPAPDPTRPVDKVAQSAGVPQPGTDVYVHERVACWHGWSLSLQRPGGALNRSADPAKALDEDPTTNEPVTPFKMTSTFTAVDRSLPRLRFGVRYRMRVRAVDLAGNSVPLTQPSQANLSLPSGTDLPYLRFEPVPHPVVVLVEGLQKGASLERLVIRSYNHDISLDSIATHENDHRHILPPRASVRMVEHHGMLDATGHLQGDSTTYDMLITRDEAQIPTVDKVPTDSRAQATAPYLPDPIARGAAFRNLPNTRSNTDGAVAKGALTFTASPQVEYRPGSVTHISFGAEWPNRMPFRLVIAEGRNKPKWDPQERVLAVYVPKSTEAEVPLSSYLEPGDLSLMGVWDWLRQYLEFAELQSIQNGGPVYPSNGMALLIQLTLEGGHPMITPARTLILVHAVQQPLGRPHFTMLPVARPAGQSSALANSFSPLTAWRDPDSHSAVLLGGLLIHGKSTSRVDIQATWREFVDDAAQPAPQQLPASAHVDKIELKSLDPGLVYADASQTRAVATYISEGDTLWFSAPGDTIPGGASAILAAPLHVFADTKHRRIQYQAVSTTRFQEYFSDTSLDFTRNSEKVVVNVPSSARPDAPDVRYVIPVFGFEKQESTNVRTVVRQGNGVRVYLGRSWYSSGESELLGVLLWNLQGTLDTPNRERYKNYITQWGMDPIWKSQFLENTPRTSDLTLAVARAQSLSLDKTDLRVDVAGHCVFFDEQRKLWYCDVVFNNPLAYGAFVRMAVARYQPHSLPGVELSHAVLADFVQLSPDRSAVLSIDPGRPSTARVFVGGLTPEGPQQLMYAVNVERRMAGVYSDVGWEPAASSVATVVEDTPGSGSPDEVLWAGTVRFKQIPPPDQFRVVIREYEMLPVDPTAVTAIAVVNQFEKRLVYAAIIPYDFPQ